MAGVGRRVLLALTLLALATLVIGNGLAQLADDPRNNSEEYWNALNGADCFGCHEGEGFQPMGFNLRERYSQLPIGEKVELVMRVYHPGGINQEIQQIAVVVNNSQAPNVQVITEDTQAPFENTYPMELSNEETQQKFDVVEGATEIYVSITALEEPTGQQVGLGGDMAMSVKRVGGQEFKSEGNNQFRFVRLDAEQIRNAGIGSYNVVASWASQITPTMPAEVLVMINYTTTETEFTFSAGEDIVIRPGEPAVDIVIPIQINSEEEGVLDFRIQSVSYWDHRPSDGASRDDGLFYRFTTMKVRGGDQLIHTSDVAVPQPFGVSVDLYNLFTRILGMVAALLVPVSMLTGGLFGKRSRRLFNKMTGGAKKRVLWHNSMSFMIIGIASLHFVLALVEAKFKWTHGLMWGGFGWLVLISLGFTGYYQVRMIKRWNYKVWRHTHLWSAVAVFAFVLFHTVLEGSDFGFVRDAYPWAERLVWPG